MLTCSLIRIQQARLSLLGSPSARRFPLFRSPLVTRHFRLTSFLSRSCALICTLEIHNFFPFNRFRTLGPKHPGWGCPFHSETHPFSSARSAQLGASLAGAFPPSLSALCASALSLNLLTFKPALLPLEPVRYNPLFLQTSRKSTERRWL